MSGIDIWFAARSLECSFGNDALLIAAQQAYAYLREGDADGWEAWIKIARALVELNPLRRTKYTISPSSVVRLVAGIGAQWANAPSLANTTHWLSLDYYQDLPWGFSVAAEPSYAWTQYDAPLAAFGVTRADSIWAVKLDVLNRRIEYAGFAPKVSVVFTDQTSNVSLYHYSRTQVQLGLTREF